MKESFDWIADPGSASIYRDATKSHLDEQLGRADSLDGKGMAILGLASGALPFFANALAFARETPPTESWILTGAGVGVYLLVLHAVYKVYQVRGWSIRPRTDLLKERSRTLSETELCWWLGKQYAASVEENEDLLDEKGRHLTRAILLLPSEFILFLLATLFALR